MFYRFLGRIFLYFVIVPQLAPLLERILRDVLKNWIDKQYATMTVDQKKRFERTSPYVPRPTERRPSTPTGFQAQSRQHN